MPHSPLRSTSAGRRLRRVLLALAALVLSAVLSGCSSQQGATFDPSAPCSSDVRSSGAYPDLEALVPSSFQGRRPDRLDSGRDCTAANLGTLEGRGISEMRFAGGLWQLGTTSGVTLAVFDAQGLTAPYLGEWYEASARDARNTTQIEPTRPVVEGTQLYRLDTVNNESHQTVIVWESGTAGRVDVVLAADTDESTIEKAIAAFG